MGTKGAPFSQPPQAKDPLMNAAPQTSELHTALVRFEALLNTVPKTDELDRWCVRLRTAFDQLEMLVQERRRRIHDKLFGTIATQDPSRQDQIARLREADDGVQKLLEMVKTHIIVQGMRRTEIEEHCEPYMLDLVDRGTELIYWIRDQEETVAAWFAEAFTSGPRQEVSP
jgi:hypothetical protein